MPIGQFLYASLVHQYGWIALIVKLTQFRITREESHNEELSALGWPVGMPQGG